MSKLLRPLLWTLRFASALGFLSLSLTNEISPGYLLLCWTAWAASFKLDTYLGWGNRLRKWETTAVLVMIAVFLIDFYYWDYAIFVCVAHFLILFQVFKMLGLKERKDSLQILMFSFFQMLSACTLSVDLWQAVILLLLIPTATAGLFWQQISLESEESHQPVPAEAQGPYRRWVTGICLAAIPVNLLFATVIFVLFPRLAFRGAFANLGGGRSGYNEQVNLAQGGTVEENSSAVLWLQFIPVSDRARWKGYLRGATLDYFDGKTWSHSSQMVSQTLYPDSNGVFTIRKGHRGLRQSITLVNTSGATLFGSPTIGEVVAPLATLQTLSDGAVRWSRGWRKPLHYDVISFDVSMNESDSRKNSNYLQMPDLSLDKTKDLVRQMAPGSSPLSKALAIEGYLRTHYQYSLDQVGTSSNPVEQFLFVRRQGPCGLFASSMAVMLRLEGIPSRIVAGYYKGSWNERLQQILMRERDAHAWVEAYIPSKGWVSFDPTPRVTSVPANQKWLLRLQKNWEYLNYQWDRLVIEYDLYSQVQTFQEVQHHTNRMNGWLGQWIDRHLMGSNETFSLRSSHSGSRGFLQRVDIKIIFLLSLLALIYWGVRRKSPVIDPTIGFYHTFLKQMARKGLPKKLTETGWEYAERLRGHLENHSAREITQQYYDVRFANLKKHYK